MSKLTDLKVKDFYKSNGALNIPSKEFDENSYVCLAVFPVDCTPKTIKPERQGVPITMNNGEQLVLIAVDCTINGTSSELVFVDAKALEQLKKVAVDAVAKGQTTFTFPAVQQVIVKTREDNSTVETIRKSGVTLVSAAQTAKAIIAATKSEQNKKDAGVVVAALPAMEKIVLAKSKATKKEAAPVVETAAAGGEEDEE